MHKKARGCAAAGIWSGITPGDVCLCLSFSLTYVVYIDYVVSDHDFFCLTIFFSFSGHPFSIWTWCQCTLCYIGAVCPRKHSPYRFWVYGHDSSWITQVSSPSLMLHLFLLLYAHICIQAQLFFFSKNFCPSLPIHVY